jgi:hypothetical protein
MMLRYSVFSKRSKTKLRHSHKSSKKKNQVRGAVAMEVKLAELGKNK